MPSRGQDRIIRISEANYRRLQAFAEPLSDTRNDAMTRVLDMAERWREHLHTEQPDPDPRRSTPDEGETAR